MAGKYRSSEMDISERQLMLDRLTKCFNFASTLNLQKKIRKK